MTVNNWSRSEPHWFEAIHDKLESKSATGNIPNSTAMSLFVAFLALFGHGTMSDASPMHAKADVR
jgi:hypothetical protein